MHSVEEGEEVALDRWEDPMAIAIIVRRRSWAEGWILNSLRGFALQRSMRVCRRDPNDNSRRRSKSAAGCCRLKGG